MLLFLINNKLLPWFHRALRCFHFQRLSELNWWSLHLIPPTKENSWEVHWQCPPVPCCCVLHGLACESERQDMEVSKLAVLHVARCTVQTFCCDLCMKSKYSQDHPLDRWAEQLCTSRGHLELSRDLILDATCLAVCVAYQCCTTLHCWPSWMEVCLDQNTAERGKPSQLPLG